MWLLLWSVFNLESSSWPENPFMDGQTGKITNHVVQPFLRSLTQNLSSVALERCAWATTSFDAEEAARKISKFSREKLSNWIHDDDTKAFVFCDKVSDNNGRRSFRHLLFRPAAVLIATTAPEARENLIKLRIKRPEQQKTTRRFGSAPSRVISLCRPHTTTLSIIMPNKLHNLIGVRMKIFPLQLAKVCRKIRSRKFFSNKKSTKIFYVINNFHSTEQLNCCAISKSGEHENLRKIFSKGVVATFRSSTTILIILCLGRRQKGKKFFRFLQEIFSGT